MLLAVLFTYLIYRMRFFRLAAVPAWVSPLLFATKLLFGFALWAVYTFYYTDRSLSDIYKYYDDALYIHQAWGEDKAAFIGLMTGAEDSSLIHYTSPMHSWEKNFVRSVPFHENRFLIRLHALMLFISGGNIHIHTILFCLLSMIGCVLLLRVFQQRCSPDRQGWVVATMLLPSFMFWTSGGLKESILILGLGLFVSGFVLLTKRPTVGILSIILGLLILLLTKYFLLLCLVPSIVGYYILTSIISWRSVAIKYLLVLVATASLVALIAPIDPRIDFARIIAKKQHYAIAEAQYMKAGSYSPVPVVSSSLWSITTQLPVGLWNTLLKPYPFSSHNPLILLSSIENILLLVLLLLAVGRRPRRQQIDFNFLFFLLTAVLLYFSIIGLMTPVLGSLVRYRVVLVPFLLYILLSSIRFPWDKES
jgi:hypothetical protein